MRLTALLVAVALMGSADPQAVPDARSAAAYGDRNCLAWSDACVTCRRGVADAPNCSVIGIACQPGPPACTERLPQPSAR